MMRIGKEMMAGAAMWSLLGVSACTVAGAKCMADKKATAERKEMKERIVKLEKAVKALSEQKGSDNTEKRLDRVERYLRLLVKHGDGSPSPPSPTSPPLPPLPAGAIKKIGVYTYRVRGDVLSKLLGGVGKVSPRVRIVPSVLNGKPEGIKLFALPPDGIYRRLGFQNGDVVLAVNNQSIATPDKALDAFTRIRGASRVSVQIRRQGKKISLVYKVVAVKKKGGSPRRPGRRTVRPTADL